MSNETETSSGLGIVPIIFLIFLTLKLGGWGIVATWSWWWVFSPLWISLLIVFIVYKIFYNK
jgi:hypothetical protein